MQDNRIRRVTVKAALTIYTVCRCGAAVTVLGFEEAAAFVSGASVLVSWSYHHGTQCMIPQCCQMGDKT